MLYNKQKICNSLVSVIKAVLDKAINLLFYSQSQQAICYKSNYSHSTTKSQMHKKYILTELAQPEIIT